MSPNWQSKPEDSRVIGWGKIDGLWFSLAPLVDVSTPEGLTASLPCPGVAEQALRMIGARLPTASEIDKLRDHGFRIEPVTLPHPFPPRNPGESDHDFGVRIYQPMATRPWAELHNQRCNAQLKGWDRTTPISNFGKHPYRDSPTAPPPGKCYLRGWWLANAPGGAKYIQGTPSPHDDGQFDYGTTTIAVFDGAQPPDGDQQAFDLFVADIPPAV